MPRYIYKCTDCQIIIEASHSIKEKLKNCSSCGISNSLKRLPTSFTVKKTKETPTKKVGETTKEKIEQFREELEVEKRKLKEEEFKT